LDSVFFEYGEAFLDAQSSIVRTIQIVTSGGVIELTNVTELSRIWMFPQNANAACNRN